MACPNTFVRQPAVDSRTLKGGHLPALPIDKHVDHAAVSADCLGRLSHLSAEHLLEEALWKDIVCMTGTNRTVFAPNAIVTLWNKLVQKRRPAGFRLVPESSELVLMPNGTSWIEASFEFETKAAPACACSGAITIVNDTDGQYKIWYFTTILEKLCKFNSPDDPPLPEIAGLERRDSGLNGPHSTTSAATPQKVQCLIIGDGPAGLCTGARMKSVGVDYLIVDRHSTVGGSWSERFDRLVMNTSKYSSDLPYHPEFEHKPNYPTKDDVAEAYQSFVRRWELNLWTSTHVSSASWQSKTKQWLIQCLRNGRPQTIEADHLVMATGSGLDVPSMPDLPDRALYSGTAIHSLDFRSSSAFAGKRGIVIGSAVSAFEVAQDMVDHQLASVTMVQRSSTAIIPIEYVEESIGALYNADTPIDVADRKSQSRPYPVSRQMIMAFVKMKQSLEPGRYDALVATGFKIDTSPDALKDLTERQGGQYLDRGGTQLIVDGKVAVKSGHAPVAFTAKGVLLSSGEELEADLIVFCTGFRGSMRATAAEIVGHEVADRMQDFWGINAEGELRGLACPVGHPNIWYIGGGTTASRFRSKLLALQIKADLENMPFEAHEMEVQ